MMTRDASNSPSAVAMPAFPSIPSLQWRTHRPCIVKLVDGDRIPAYPVIGLITEEGRFCFGEACTDRMWLVADSMIESPLIRDCGNARILSLDAVVGWESLVSCKTPVA